MASRDPLHEYLVTEIIKDPTLELGETQPLVRDGLLNSIGIMKLISFMSERFGVQFADEDYELDNFETLASIRRLIETRSASAAVSQA